MAPSLETSGVKAALFNLIVYTETEKRVPYFRSVVDSIIEKFPCRILFIRGDSFGGESIFRVEKTLRTNGVVSCDQIDIHATGKHLKEVPFFILPHLAPDLPIAMLWGEDPTKESAVFSEILGSTERLIIDAESIGDLEAFAKRMAKHSDSLPYALIDMHWARIAGWRHVMATVFDTASKLELLKEATEIQIVYNNRKADAFTHPEIGALYLRAWLTARLKCSHFKLEGRPFETLGAATIAELHVRSKKGSEFHLTRSDQAPRSIRVTQSTLETCNLPFTLPLTLGATGPSFIKELLYAPPSPHYFEMLTYLAEKR